uniref:PiggyBac transposable element-derived protein domain-containing protein n=1 Tax=Clastoptera arizonana TaxID=38151 RepID=A0A1B6DE87_9HEMI
MTKTYSCPKVVKDYNSFMGGVDKADHLRSLYPVDSKSRKWWHRLFWEFTGFSGSSWTSVLRAFSQTKRGGSSTSPFLKMSERATGGFTGQLLWNLMGGAKSAVKEIQSRPHSKGFNSKVFLCVNEKKNCFAEYYGIE